jgi:hypothetical protein
MQLRNKNSDNRARLRSLKSLGEAQDAQRCLLQFPVHVGELAVNQVQRYPAIGLLEQQFETVKWIHPIRR